ncbi:MAG: indole-3-glycerol-phosphate synthase [Desulfurococcales archaeon]|nr:indole-3-glycerol-phosphate synthase [Desulfurococcales archaeon]
MSFLDEAKKWSLERARILEGLLEGRTGGAASLRDALRRGEGPALIVEYKRCSPSAGMISLRSPEEYIEETLPYARAYSVLTEPRWFCGSLELIPLFTPHRPVLAKDFIVGQAQLEAYRRLGASAVLLIARMLSGGLGRLCKDATTMGLEALVEAHNLGEALEAYYTCPNAMLGVNSRDLARLRVDFEGMLGVVRRLRSELGDDALIVAESGVDSPGRAVEALEAGADALLIGTAAMRNPGLLREIWRAYGSPP